MTTHKSGEQSQPETDTSPHEANLVKYEETTTRSELPTAKTLLELATQNWKSNRAAVVHSIDISAKHSQHAEKIFRGFRQGIYARDADFYVGDVSEWIDQQFALRGAVSPEHVDRTFLSHVILDLPGSDKHIGKAASALRADGVMMVFNPSITQIMACIKMVRNEKMPLVLDTVVELGLGMTGGRAWDVRTVKPRALLKKEKAEQESPAAVGDAVPQDLNALLRDLAGSEGMEGEGEEQFDSSSKVQAKVGEQGDTGWEMICRPKAWARVVGGGFLGVWRKMKYSEGTSEN